MGTLCDVSEVIANHFIEESFAVVILGALEALVDTSDDSLAFFVETVLHLFFVGLE
tara:strand:+ start:395 stop:562 length:168 start_codon:yes stop_codon:yes gene_type:complete